MDKTKNSLTSSELELKKLRQLLKEKTEKLGYLEKLLDVVPGTVYCKEKGKFIYCNNNLAKIFKLQSNKDVVGKTDYDFMSKKLADTTALNDKIIMETGKEKIIEEKGLSVDGEPAIYLTNKIPLRDMDNKVVGIVGVSIDITDRKRAEELHIKHEAAKKVITFTNKVAGSIAHELRTPLSIINTQTDLQDLALSSDKSQHEKEEICKQAIKNTKVTIKASAHVIDDMLIKIRSFSQGKIESIFNTVSITTDMEEFLSTYPFRENEKKLVQLKNFDSLESRFKYLGDPVLTKHIFSNLMKNSLYAIKEAEKGDITIELKAGDAKDKFNYLIFRDTASGVAPEYVDKMFNHFESKKGTSGGTGLGLSFCKMVMETYGGDITCKSKQGEYIEFSLSFPKI
jgi:two-component system, sensor histidine kinase and response regulator